MIRVALVEDDLELADQLCRLINESPGFKCIVTLKSGEEALASIPKHKPDVVLMDINLPAKDGIQTVRELKAKCPRLNILMLTVSNDSKRLFESLKAGASGYMLKRTSTEKLLAAIREVHEGGAPMSAQIARQVVLFFQRGQSQLESLSAREQQVLSLLAQGHFYKEIADTMDISMNTVRSFIRRIYEKLQVNSRSEAIAKYFER